MAIQFCRWLVSRTPMLARHARFVLLDWLWDTYFGPTCFSRSHAVSHCELSATHPDCVGGLGFIAVGHSYFGFECLLPCRWVNSTFVAQTVLETHTNLQAYSNLGIVFVLLVLLLFLGPLLV